MRLDRQLLAVALAAVLATPLTVLAATAPTQVLPPATTTTVPVEQNATDAVSAATTAKETSPPASTAPAATDPAKSKEASAVAASPQASASATTSGDWWAATDKDGDGKISAIEAKANAGLDARFKEIDADVDGSVTLEEYRKYYASTLAPESKSKG